MAITVSDPTIWSTRLRTWFERKLVLANAFTNSDYEGEISGAGSTVKILRVGAVTISNYTGTLAAPEDLTDTADELVIDQKKYFNFGVDDTDDRRSMLNLIEKGAEKAAVGMASVVDQFIASFHASISTATPDNTYGDSTTPIIVGGGAGEVHALDVIAELNQRLDDADIPAENRRIGLPAWFIRRLKKELGGRLTAVGDDVTINGLVGTIDTLQVFHSNNIVNTAGAKYKIMCGLPVITFASALTKTETYRVEAAFKTGVKGLHVYGGRLVSPEAMALATCTAGDLTA